MNLDDIIEFSNVKTVSRPLHESEKVKSVCLCVSEGQEALQESENCKVAMLVCSGSGSVLTNGDEYDIEAYDLIVFEKNEDRLLKARTQLTAIVTFIQE